jgi:hypothetical protein
MDKPIEHYAGAIERFLDELEELADLKADADANANGSLSHQAATNRMLHGETGLGGEVKRPADFQAAMEKFLHGLDKRPE